MKINLCKNCATLMLFCVKNLHNLAKFSIFISGLKISKPLKYQGF